MTGKRLAIIGSSGLAREVLWVIRESNASAQAGDATREFLDVVGFVSDDTPMHGETICGVPVLGPVEWLLKNRDVSAICAIGNPRDRAKITGWLQEEKVEFVTVVDPSARMSEFVKIGDGCVICAGVVITTQVEIGNHVYINLNVTIGHDVVIGDCAIVAPGVNLSGNVDVGYGADLGTNSSIIQGLKVGRGAIVGAGSVVNRDVEPNTVSVGVPARAIKTVREPL